MTSGVPKGSHLDPILYNAYFYDISNYFKHTRYLMCANDEKIYVIGRLSEYYITSGVSVTIKNYTQITFTR